MRKFKGAIYGLVAVALFFVSMGQLYSGFTGGGEAGDKMVAQYQRLSTEGEQTVAVTDSVYTETSTKYSTTYDVDYTFEVEGRKYKGNYEFDDMEDVGIGILQVTYLPEDPNINAIEVEEKAAKVDSENYSPFTIGLVMLLAAAFFGWRAYSRFAE